MSQSTIGADVPSSGLLPIFAPRIGDMSSPECFPEHLVAVHLLRTEECLVETEDGVDVALDGLGRYDQPLGYLVVGESEGKSSEHLLLSRGKEVLHLGLSPDGTREWPRDGLASAPDLPDASGQLLATIGLQAQAIDARTNCIPQCPCPLLGRIQNHSVAPRAEVGDVACDRLPVPFDPEVEDDDIRRRRFVVDLARMTNNPNTAYDVWMAMLQCDQAVAYDIDVVDCENVIPSLVTQHLGMVTAA